MRHYKVDFTAGNLTKLYLNVTAGIAIGGAVQVDSIKTRVESAPDFSA